MNKNSHFTSINPFTEELIGEYTAIDSLADITYILDTMNLAQQEWARQTIEKRIEFLPILAHLLHGNVHLNLKVRDEPVGYRL